MHRRDLLRAGSTVGALCLSGCLVTGGDDPQKSRSGATLTPTDADGGPDRRSGTPTPAASLEVGGSTLETTAARCGGPGGASTDWTVVGDTVAIAGRFPVSNPCHGATIEEVAVSDGVISVRIGATSTTDHAEECVQCVGEVRYEVEIEVNHGEAVEDVTIEQPTTPSNDRS